MTQAEARVAQAQVQFEREQAEARLAVEEWDELGLGEPTALVIREPQLARARADLESSRAALEQAGLQLERTRIRAPFAGRLEEKRVDVGQFVGPGTALARIYSTDRAEVSLEISQDDVLLTGRIAASDRSWPARVVRTGSRINPMTRMISIITEVEDPFSLAGTHPAPLPMGLFLEAEIEGKTVADAIVLPRAALRTDGSVLVVTSDDRIDIRAVEILRISSEEAILSGGLASGERVCVSPLAAVVDGMRVRVQSPDSAVVEPSLEGDRS